MYTCYCGKEFVSHTALGGHMGSHARGAKFKENRKKSPVSYNCLFCNKEVEWSRSKLNKFCNNECHNEYKWKNETSV